MIRNKSARKRYFGPRPSTAHRRLTGRGIQNKNSFACTRSRTIHTTYRYDFRNKLLLLLLLSSRPDGILEILSYIIPVQYVTNNRFAAVRIIPPRWDLRDRVYRVVDKCSGRKKKKTKWNCKKIIIINTRIRPSAGTRS